MDCLWQLAYPEQANEWKWTRLSTANIYLSKMLGLGTIQIFVTGSGHTHTYIYLDELSLPCFYSSEQIESTSIWQYEFMLPRVLCAVCLTVCLSVLLWLDYSPLGDSVTAGIECILGSAMYLKSTGMSLKKAQSTVSTTEDGLNTKWDSILSSPEARKTLIR